ncbi:hypothetical protein ETB97_010272 [Aspergillus alliaceus]|uniref:Uncharacterized protein n=1 Tax=Petromyces alliaceus TaxID=209559 RepID=A0A8H5ZRE2_PETAA|nr:hypothetical protein ETB97_010272 [Aspergillus burnettii]
MDFSSEKPVYHSWDTVYDRRVSLLKEATCGNNPELLAAIRVHYKLDYIDYDATFSWALNGPPSEPLHEFYKEAEAYLQNENRKEKNNCDDIIANMKRLAQKSATQEEWTKWLDIRINQEKRKTSQTSEELYHWGKEKIKYLPLNVQDYAANTYHKALFEVSMFLSKVLYGLEGVQSTIERFLKDVWANIKKFVEATHDFFIASCNGVRQAFPPTSVLLESDDPALSFTRIDSDEVRDEIKSAEGISGLGNLSKKLQDINMDSIALS